MLKNEGKKNDRKETRAERRRGERRRGEMTPEPSLPVSLTFSISCGSKAPTWLAQDGTARQPGVANLNLATCDGARCIVRKWLIERRKIGEARKI